MLFGVAEGRASNYLFGLDEFYLFIMLALQKASQVGEVLTTSLFFTIMQPIGLLVWNSLIAPV